MKSLIKYIFIVFSLGFLLIACKTTKNTFVHRGYHNLTARYNGYYYATESIKEAEDKIRKSYAYDYDRLLPVYLIPTNETVKSTFPDFDKSIKKSSNAIQRHTIKDKKGNEIHKAGHWIDNNWNVIGISHFYKREFFSAIEAFEYVIRSYKSPDKYKAMVWLARSYNEIGAVSQAEPIIALLKDDKKISKYAKTELPALQADYYLRRGMYKEAEKALLAAIKARPSRKTRARYSFILGQIYEQNNSNKKAREYYHKTIKAKPDYDLVFHAKMKEARLVDLKYGNTAKLKRDLLKMTRDEKNSEYLDIIYYTLGEISEREKNEAVALSYYKLSVAKSTQNPKQKALSYLKLGEINFEQTNYVASGAYYDSTMISLPKDYKDYEAINNRKQTLETLVGYINDIHREDSLQRIAKMSEKDRDRFITKMIKDIEDEEARKKEEQELLLAQNTTTGINATNTGTGMTDLGATKTGNWYFYNTSLVAFGVNDFIKKFGNRKLEDNWRRSQKAITFDNPETVPNDSLLNGKDSLVVKNSIKAQNKKNVEYYLKDLPLTDSLLTKSNNKIIDAYYNLASTYKDDLKNNKKAIAAFEDVNKRFPTHKFRPSTYFQLYKIFQSVKNTAQADNYKNKLLTEFPNSEYAQLIKNPNYEAEKNTQKGAVEIFYTATYNSYSAGNYSDAYDKSKESETKFGNNDFSGRFAFIKAMCIGKAKGADSLEMALKLVQALYPKDPVTLQAQDLLEVLYNLKHPSEGTGPQTANLNDTLTLDLKAKHFVVAIMPDDAEMANSFKSSLGDFNTNFYGISNLSVNSSLFGTNEQIVNVKLFEDAQSAMKYIDNLFKDKTVFSGKVKPELFTIMAISEANLPRLYRKNTLAYYKPFYEDHYRK